MAVEIETHAHEVIDTDPRFIIDPKTKKITAGTGNLTLAQHAKNSERLTFYLPEKVVEGHDMTVCNNAQIHFENIDQATLKRSAGVYEVTDLQQDSEGVSLSWLVDDKVTRYAGGLIFSIHFICIADDGSILYDFPTLTYSEMTVGATVWAGDTIEEQYPDIIREFEARISALEKGGTVSPEQIQEAVDNYLDEHPVSPSGKIIFRFKVTEGSGGAFSMEIQFTDGTSDTFAVPAGEKPAQVTYNGVAIPIEWAVSE